MIEGLGKKIDAADQRQGATKTGSNAKLTLEQINTVKELEDFNKYLNDESYYTKTVISAAFFIFRNLSFYI